MTVTESQTLGGCFERKRTVEKDRIDIWESHSKGTCADKHWTLVNYIERED